MLERDFEVFEDPRALGSITLESLWAVATGEKPGVSKEHQALARNMFMMPGFFSKLDVINGLGPALYDEPDGAIRRYNIESFIGLSPLSLRGISPADLRPQWGGAPEHNPFKPKY
ncbi:hypothetical protein BFW89_19005 [Pseudomonas synxantha]|nr:hypothetical protein BFW89_19005 [Pseudomonas synxantha]